MTGQMPDREKAGTSSGPIAAQKLPRARSARANMSVAGRQLTQLVAADDVESNARLGAMVAAGLPLEVLNSRKDMMDLMVVSGVIPRKTLEDARKRKVGVLTAANSERVVRAMRLSEKAKAALGEKTAEGWMKKSNQNFDGKSAMQMAKTESGARAVEQFLLRLAHGFNA
jgi:putative toxin-antitoxin system antitoxin component (TIGR02293 family)